jgi:hypothetical protein
MDGARLVAIAVDRALRIDTVLGAILSNRSQNPSQGCSNAIQRAKTDSPEMI